MVIRRTQSDMKGILLQEKRACVVVIIIVLRSLIHKRNKRVLQRYMSSLVGPEATADCARPPFPSEARLIFGFQFVSNEAYSFVLYTVQYLVINQAHYARASGKHL